MVYLPHPHLLDTRHQLHRAHFCVCFNFWLCWLGLRYRVQAFSSCIRQGLLSSCSAQASHCGGFLGPRCAGFSGCSTQAQYLKCMGLVAPQHMESSRTRDQTHVPCIGSWIVNHCTAREVPGHTFEHESLHTHAGSSLG